MHNEPALIKRQRELLGQANALITMYEKGTAELKATQDHERTTAKQRYKDTEGELVKREQEVEQWKKDTERSEHTDRFLKKASPTSKASQAFPPSAQNSLQQIDDLIKFVKNNITYYNKSSTRRTRQTIRKFSSTFDKLRLVAITTVTT